ncbi:MAG: transcriptional repressor [Ignavibacteriales bacterium]|nr:transcriptional repressor [Ignavibacteriales bacterium]
MEQHGTKRSRQREKIFQVLKRTTSHPTAEWVYERVREQIPRISLGTVYRNLHILKEQGKIRELDFGEGLHRYDAMVEQHYHFVCQSCGVVKDLDVPPQQDLHQRVESAVAGTIRSHRLDFYGICNECVEQEQR